MQLRWGVDFWLINWDKLEIPFIHFEGDRVACLGEFVILNSIFQCGKRGKQI